jgi:hypothetical protein
MNKIFDKKLDADGWCWKKVPRATKEFYWGEFQVLSI